MIRLASIALREVRLPLVETFTTAGGAVGARRVLLLELTDTDGTTAWSECVAEESPAYSPDTVDTCWLAITQWLAPRALGVGFAGPRDAHAVLGSGVRGHRMARAALEMGVWGLAAEREALPLAALIARESVAARERGAPPRLSVDAGVAIGIQRDPAVLAERCLGAVAAGYRRVRMKIEPGCDVAYVRAVREALGPDVSLAVDANGSYAPDDASHVAALDALDRLGLAMIEQPLAYDDLVRHAALQQRLRTRLCLDESITGRASTEDALGLGSARVINIKAGRVGGLREAIAIHDLCAERGVPVWCGGMLETGVGRAYNVALAALPGFTEPGDLSPSARYWERDVVTPEWTMDAAGRVRVPLDRPGIGVTVATARVDDLTVRARTLRAT